MPSPRLRLQLINQQSPTNAAKVAQAPKNPNPITKPSRDLSCGSMCNEGDFDEHADRQRRSTFIMYEVSRRQEFLLRNPEKKPPDDNELKPMAQNKATPDAAQTSGRGGLTKSQRERVRRVECRGTVGTLGDRKNVITANVSMQF